MSGHSKWAQIKRQKGAADAKRSALFTKLGQAIAIAARDGTDPSTNFKLRLAIDRAKAANLPNDNIDRAIQRGSGAVGGSAFEEIHYEAFGPGGVALVISALTDNRNRTTAEVRSVLSRHGAALATTGSVSWQFEPKGVLRISRDHLPSLPEELELTLIDAGAEDFDASGDGVTITTPPEKLESVRTVLARRSVTVDDAIVELVPKNRVELPPAVRQQLEKLEEDLDALDDVQSVSTNVREIH